MKTLVRLDWRACLCSLALAVIPSCTSGAVDSGEPGGSGSSSTTPNASGAGTGSVVSNGAGATSVVVGGGSGPSGSAAGSSTGGASAGGAGTPGSAGSSAGGSASSSGGASAGGTAGSAAAGGTKGGAGASSGAPGAGGQPPVLSGGSNGWATRYWDCCKPACGWKANVPSGTNPIASCSVTNQSFGSNYDQASACPNGSNGPAFMCQNFGPWAVSDTLAYGFAAVNKGSDYCGRCYQLQFTGTSHNSSNDTGSQSLSGKTMIVQAINTGGIDGNQFDLLIPGGGVGDYNACVTQWGTSSLGEQYGGFFLACQKANGYDYSKSKACAAAKCESVFSGKPDLLASCNWFVTWFGAPDNPALMYKEVTCPAALSGLSGLHR